MREGVTRVKWPGPKCLIDFPSRAPVSTIYLSLSLYPELLGCVCAAVLAALAVSTGEIYRCKYYSSLVCLYVYIRIYPLPG